MGHPCHRTSSSWELHVSKIPLLKLGTLCPFPVLGTPIRTRMLKKPTSFPPQRARPPSPSSPEPETLPVFLRHGDFLSFWSKDPQMAMENTAKHSSVIVSHDFLTLMPLLCDLPRYLACYQHFPVSLNIH